MAEFFQYDWNTVTLPSSYNDVRRRNQKPDLIMARSLLKDLIDCCTDYELKQFCHRELGEKNLLKFLHVSKLNPDRAFELITNWLVYRNKHPEIFEKNFRVSNPLILKALKDGFPMVLENCDRKGRAVLILNARNWNSCYSLITIYQSLILSIDRLTNDTKYLLNGLVIIVDWTGFTLRQCKQLNPMSLKIMLDGLQNCFPAKFKGVHFIEQPWFVEMSLMVVKPFLNEKTSNRLVVHGNNLSTLHDFLPRDILPTELGGDIASINTDIWIQKILDGAENS